MQKEISAVSGPALLGPIHQRFSLEVQHVPKLVAAGNCDDPPSRYLQKRSQDAKAATGSAAAAGDFGNASALEFPRPDQLPD
jgi:hypothetical protein